MTKNTIAAGRNVRFEPFETDKRGGSSPIMVTGTIVKVYPEHKWFSVVYGNPNLRTSFKFCDVGERVKFVG